MCLYSIFNHTVASEHSEFMDNHFCHCSSMLEILDTAELKTGDSVTHDETNCLESFTSFTPFERQHSQKTVFLHIHGQNYKRVNRIETRLTTGNADRQKSDRQTPFEYHCDGAITVA